MGDDGSGIVSLLIVGDDGEVLHRDKTNVVSQRLQKRGFGNDMFKVSIYSGKTAIRREKMGDAEEKRVYKFTGEFLVEGLDEGMVLDAQDTVSHGNRGITDKWYRKTSMEA